MSDAVKPALHGRDHCPGGVDPIPCLPIPTVFRAMQWVTGTSTPGGGDMALVEFDKFDAVTGQYFGGNLSGSDLLSIEGLNAGLYIVTMTWYWDSNFTASHGGLIENGLGVGIVEPNMVEMPHNMPAGHGGSVPTYSFTVIQHYPRLYDELNLATPVRTLPDFSFWVGQDSAGAVDAYVSAEVAYWSDQTPVA